MKTWKKFLSLAILAGIATACSDDDCDCVSVDGRTQIRLSSSVDVSTARIQDLQIAQGQNVSFFVTDNGSTQDLQYDNVNIIADGEGGFAYSTPMYYPLGSGTVDFYAIHPYDEGYDLNTARAFTVSASQNVQNNYLASDLLYASVSDVAATTRQVSLGFVHKLARINITLVQGTGLSLTDLESVTILNLLPTATIDPATGALGAASGTTQPIVPFGVSPASGTETEIENISAIVVPQTLTQGNRLIRITIAGSDFYYTPGSNVTFSSGYQYNYTLTVNQAGIEVSSSIDPWENGGSVTGEGSIE